MNKQNGGEFASGPVSLKECTLNNAPKVHKKPKNKKISLFSQKISKNYCGIKNNAYLCIESNGDSTDAAGSANTKCDKNGNIELFNKGYQPKLYH